MKAFRLAMLTVVILLWGCNRNDVNNPSDPGIDFRMEMSSRTKRIWDEGGTSCVETQKKTFVPAMMSCNRITEIDGDSFSAQHSQVVSNPGGDGYQVVYFKESIKAFVSVPGGLLLYYINYSRSKRVTGIAHGLVRGKLKGTEEDAIALLAEKLAGGR